MNALPVFVFLLLASGATAASNLDQARKLEAAGDTAAARTLLARAAESNPSDPVALSEYAQFLDRYGDPGARAAYDRLLRVLRASGNTQAAADCARRLAVLHLTAGDGAAASSVLRDYRQITGSALDIGAAAAPGARATIAIPGPLRSFARMAAISPDTAPGDILPAVARNVVTNGFQASHSNDALEQTEYLKLVHRYLSQARELQKLSGAEKTIRIENCDSPKAADLLRIIGFRMRGGCGSEVVLETVNATRAFLTTDSGFPVNELEQALRTNRPFSYPFAPTAVPVLYTPEYWLTGAKEKDSADFIDTFLSDPALCRLYLGLSKLDRDTADALRKQMAVTRLKAFSHVLDFFGGMFEIRDGKAVVPGGQRSAAAWGDLVGASPDNGAAFFERLLSRDDGWLASLFDALLRIRGPVRDYLTEPARIKRFYAAVRGKVTSPGPARPVFRSNTDMLLLTTRLRLDPNGKPHVPGSLEVWKNLFVNHPQGKYDGKLTRSAASWKDSDDVLEALFALCRKAVENEPLKIFMAMTDLDRNRAQPLEPATVDRLARRYRFYSSQYSIFAESPALSDRSILAYMDTAEAVNKVRDPLLRSNTAGSLQALVGLWQIFVRQATLPQARADQAFSSLVAKFGEVRNNRDLFDASRSGVQTLLAATATRPGAQPQDRLVDLLAGAPESQDTESHTQLVQDMVRILEAQRIISLNLLFQLSDHLDAVARGEKLNTQLVNRVAGRLSEIQAPRAALSASEKNALGFGYWTEKHIENQRKLNLKSAVERAAADKKTVELRGLLAPILRDTLVAFNYVHYAPPGAQILFTNPVFVRSHDFLGVQGSNHTWRQTEMFGTGWPSNGGGRLVGSLAGLPYALAEAEQNFLVPSQTQALIWGDLVPQMILSAKIPRWWNVTPSQMHWAALHLRYGRALLGEAAIDPALRADALDALALYAPPARTRDVARLLASGNVRAAEERVTPSELFAIARELAPKRSADRSCYAVEIRRLASEYPDRANYAAVSRAFGTPKPTLANSYQPEILALRTFPTLMGYSSRIMAESWESNTLYWVALADEAHLPPSQLNLRIPEWTQKLVEQIFASHLEDWPAVLKSLNAVGDDVRARLRASGDLKAGLPEPAATAAGVR
jgi:hypothetical protein